MERSTCLKKYGRSLVHAGESGMAMITVLLLVCLLTVIGVTLNRTTSIQTAVSSNLMSRDNAFYIANAGVQHALFMLKRAPSSRGTLLEDVPFGSGSYTVVVSDAPSPMGPVLISSKGVTGEASATVEKRINPTGIFTVYPRLMQDTFISEETIGMNFGASARLDLGLLSTGLPRRLMFELDMSAIPSDANIQSATLELYLYGGLRDTVNANELDIKLYRMTVPWNEGIKDGENCTEGATWTRYDCIGSWTAAGGDFDPSSISNTKIFYDSIGQWYQWDAKNLVQGWVDGTYVNYGLILIDNKEANNETKNFIAYFHSGEYSVEEALRPKFTVVFSK